jgi:hypothetical protein
MSCYQLAGNTIYFETICVIAFKPNRAVQPAALKLQAYCRETNTKPYVIQMMDDKRTCALLLTKQNLTAKTAYHCCPENLKTRRFAALETLTGNNVKRLLSKSDSKFFCRFSNLLLPGLFYTKQIDNNSAVKFSKSGSEGVQMGKVKTDKRWKFESPSECYVIESETPDLVTLASCKVSPPNLMMNLWDAPEVARQYILEDIASGVVEDRNCKEGFIVEAPSKKTISLPGLGHIEVEAEELSDCAKMAEAETDDSIKTKTEDSQSDCSVDYQMTTIKQTIDIINSTGPKTYTPEPKWLADFARLKQSRQKSQACYRLF